MMVTVMQWEVLNEYIWDVIATLMRVSEETKKSKDYVEDDKLVTSLLSKYREAKLDELDWEEEAKTLRELKLKYAS